jgi:hypothetical protein
VKGETLKDGSMLLRRASVLPLGLRILAIAAGILSGMVGTLGLGFVFLIIPVPLVVSAIIQPYMLQVGRWIFWFGAVLLTFYVVVYIGPAFKGIIPMLEQFHALQDFVMPSFIVLACLLVLILDVALLLHEVARAFPNTDSAS